jgi:hypothetical protein
MCVSRECGPDSCSEDIAAFKAFENLTLRGESVVLASLRVKSYSLYSWHVMSRVRYVTCKCRFLRWRVLANFRSVRINCDTFNVLWNSCSV